MFQQLPSGMGGGQAYISIANKIKKKRRREEERKEEGRESERRGKGRERRDTCRRCRCFPFHSRLFAGTCTRTSALLICLLFSSLLSLPYTLFCPSSSLSFSLLLFLLPRLPSPNILCARLGVSGEGSNVEKVTS